MPNAIWKSWPSKCARSWAKKSEDNLVALWAETQEAISDYATENGIELVFGFGEPLDKALSDRFPNINRKMNAMDGAPRSRFS